MSATHKQRVAGLLVCLTLTPLQILAASVPNFPPNPYGEKMFRAHMYHHMLAPLGLIAAALLVTWLIHKFAQHSDRRKAGTPKD